MKVVDHFPLVHFLSYVLISNGIICQIVIVAQLMAYGGCSTAPKTVCTDSTPLPIAVHLHQSLSDVLWFTETNLPWVWNVPDPSSICTNTQQVQFSHNSKQLLCHMQRSMNMLCTKVGSDLYIQRLSCANLEWYYLKTTNFSYHLI